MNSNPEDEATFIRVRHKCISDSSFWTPIVEAVTEQLSKGTAFTLATEIEIEYAEYLCSRNSGFERIRFVNSGTEAVMGALKAARAATGRPKIAKIEGAYHGTYDFAEVSQTANPTNWGRKNRPESVPVAFGTPRSVLEDVVVLPFNDPERAVDLLDECRGEIACVILDPMPHRVGLSPASPDFVRALREWTASDGALLVFDEVITFRAEYGGFQERYDSVPDLTALGKVIGRGFPVCALAGRAYEKTGELDRAIAGHTEAIRLLGDDPESIGCLGRAHGLAGRASLSETLGPSLL